MEPANASLLNLITCWDGNTFVRFSEGLPEIITRVALAQIGALSPATLNEGLLQISATLRPLDPDKSKIERFQNILAVAGARSRGEIEADLGLADWDAGPQTEEAKRRIVDCYLTRSNNLNLNSMGLTSLPTCLSTFSHLKSLRCSHNLLTSLPNGMTTLRDLDCSDNLLTSLPDGMTTLRDLNCKQNRLTSLPDGMTALRMLDCKQNRLTSLPGGMASLTMLNCSDNLLTSLPDGMYALRSLYCSYNRLTAQPELPHLKILTDAYNTYNTSPLAIESLLTFITSWNGDAFVSTPEGGYEIVTEAIIANIGHTNLAAFSEILVQIYDTLPVDDAARSKIERLQNILNVTRGRSIAEIETELGLDDWDAGPQTVEAIRRIVDCYLTRSNNLNLNSMGLTSLPICLSNFHHLKTLHCDQNELTSLPGGMIALERLYCSDNHLASLPDGMDELTVLNCSNNRFTSLPGGMTVLTSLDCSNNQLSSLPDDMTALTTLKCSENDLNSLPDNMTALRDLDCSSNQLSSLPDGMTALTNLDCSKNGLRSLPVGMNELTDLNCSYTQLLARPLVSNLVNLTDICNLYNDLESAEEFLLPMITSWNGDAFVSTPEGGYEIVTEAIIDNIGHTNLAAFSEILVQIYDTLPVDDAARSKIERLQNILNMARGRSIAEIEAELGLEDWDAGLKTEEAKRRIVDCYLTRSIILDLNFMRLTSLPPCLSNFRHLKTLDCAHNELASLPDGMTALTELNCSDNQLISLPIGMTALTTLDCRDNQLTSLPVGMTALTELNCRDNQLISLPIGMTALTTLDCRDNQLTSLPVGMTALTELNCSSNQLTSLPVGMTALTELHCSENRLLSLPDGMTALTYLDCSDNQLTARPESSRLTIFNDLNNRYNTIAAALLAPFRIPCSETSPYWCRILMNEVRKHHSDEDHSAQVSVGSPEITYKMWCIEGDLESKIFLKPIESGDGITFVFNESHALDRIEGAEGPISLEDLVKPDNNWGKVLDQFADGVLKEHGIVRDGYTIKVHDLAIRKFPQQVLKLVAEIISSQAAGGELNVRYFTDTFNISPGIDAGGLSRQFVTDLSAALFTDSESAAAPLSITLENMPTLREGEEALYQNFGKFLSLVILSSFNLSTGVILNPNFYFLLHEALTRSLSEDVLAAELVKLNPPAAEGGFTPRELQLHQVMDWYLTPTDDTTLVLDYLEFMGLPQESPPSLEELKSLIKENILDSFISQAQAILNTLAGMTPAAKARLAAIAPGKESEVIQGTPVTAEGLLAAIKLSDSIPNPPTAAQAEKIGWIRERIIEKRDDPIWLSKFLFFVTGQKFLTPQSKILLIFTASPSYNAHTCFSRLDIPLDLNPADGPYPSLSKKDYYYRLLDDSLETASFTTG